MSDLKICRICLCKGVKVYNYDHYNLKHYYEQVLASEINHKDGLPHYFCYMCATMLHKYHKFKEMCHMGQSSLQELLWKEPLTITSISQIDRQSKNLISPIDILHVSKKVKIYNVKSKLLPENNSDDDSDNSSDSTTLPEVINELFDKYKEDIDEDDENALSDFDLNEDEDLESVKYEEDKIDIEEENFSKEIFVNEENKCHDTEILSEDGKQTTNEHQKGETAKEESERYKCSVNRRKKKFEISNVKWNYLDPKHWLNMSLNEEEAETQFKARASHPRYRSSPYKCLDCLKGYSKEDILTRHTLSKHSESLGTNVCRFCKMRFKRNCYLTKHMVEHYKRYKCLRCDLVCPLEMTALFHNDIHNGVIRKCAHCGNEFRHLSTYYTHLRTHRSEHLCTICGESFVSNGGLRQHKRLKHIDIETAKNPEEEEETKTFCERCDIQFDTGEAYKEHFFHSNRHAEGVEDIAQEIPASKDLKRRKPSARNPRVFTTCSICNMSFSANAAYIRHHSAEHKEKPIPGENLRVTCPICGMALKPNSVTTHLNTHTRQTTYPCPTCGKEFSVKNSMERHQLVHTKEKPFKCELCDTRFTQKGSLALHHRTIHLKEPHPKRNRRKKPENLTEMPILEAYNSLKK